MHPKNLPIPEAVDGILLPTPPFQHCHRLIQDCGQNTEDHDGHDHEIQLEDLAAVDDEEAKACLGGEKLADDDTHETKTDVDLHVADDERNGAGQQDLCEDILPLSAERIDQPDLVRIHGEKAIVER